MKCDVCHTDTASPHRAVINGVYYSHVCINCVGGHTVTSLDASFQRERGRDENAKETLQPFNSDGSVNSNFAEAYPRTAEQVLGKENLKEI